uniref:GRANULINS domain-containing protein n=1 Tax=Globodera pallida TaxID=36090 RepID=A0A183CEL3_GLOPA
MLLSEDKCKTIVEKHCHCRWAMCHERAGWGASLCCPDGYDLVCCTSDSTKINVDTKKKSEEILIANFGAAPQTAVTREMYKNAVCLKTVEKYCFCKWAKCIKRHKGRFEASICCDKGFDIVCCVGLWKL